MPSEPTSNRPLVLVTPLLIFFPRELEQGLVPEWRVKYFDYKVGLRKSPRHAVTADGIPIQVGKKKVKAVVRALRNVNQTPKTPGRQKPANLFSTAPVPPSFPDRRSSDSQLVHGSPHVQTSARVSSIAGQGSLHDVTDASTQVQDHAAVLGEENQKLHNETSPLAIKDRRSRGPDEESFSQWDSGALTSYGSIVPSPPTNPVLYHPPSLELPDPALSPNEDSYARHNRAWRHSRLNPNATPLGGDAYRVGIPATPTKIESSLLTRRRSLFGARKSSWAGSSPARPRPLIRRIFSSTGLESPRSADVPLEAYKEFDTRQADFLKFLDKELHKIETFYKMKETEAGERLRILRQQLHEMRDRRMEEVLVMQRARNQAKRDQTHWESDNGEGSSNENKGPERSLSTALKWMHPLENAISGPRTGKSTKGLEFMAGSSSGSPSEQRHGAQSQTESWRDFSRRPPYHDDVPYRSAKRKLRLALQEFYRGLELLKSYALLNRTAFRKINKKYDKAVKARPTGRYMSEKVNKAWFVQSEVLEGQIVAVEDLYARYFERGNHKVAVGKLRTKHTRAEDYTGSIFRNGLLIAAGLVFGMQGVIRGAELLSGDDPIIKVNVSYLLQVILPQPFRRGIN